MTNAKIVLERGENIEIALRKLKKQLEAAETMREFRRASAFSPKGERRRSKNRKALARKIAGVKKDRLFSRPLDGPDAYA